MSTFRLEESIGFLVNMAGRSLTNSVQRRFTEHGCNVTTEHWTILVRLWNEDGLTQLEVAERTGKDQASVSRLVQNMLNRGLIYRKKDPLDARCKRIYLTEKGLELQQQLMDLVLETMDEAIDGINEEEIETTKHVLKTMIRKSAAISWYPDK